MASVRYIVNDVDEAVSFYRDQLDVTVEMHVPSKFAVRKQEIGHEKTVKSVTWPWSADGSRKSHLPKLGGDCRPLILKATAV